jgi:hypothetical protein
MNGANGLIVSGSQSDRKSIYYSQSITPAWPNLSSACILLTFALKEAQQLQIPPHLPPTRAVADAQMRVGPTMEDYSAMASYRTLLLGDSCPSHASVFTASTGVSRSMYHDQDFARMARALDPLCEIFRSDIPSYVPGSLSGLWEGTWMVSEICIH